jgi:hypothetical protein
MADAAARFLLERPLAGFDHTRAFTQDELLAFVYEMRDVESAGVASLDDICVGFGGRLKWASPADGLRSARAIIELYEKWLSGPNVPGRAAPDSLRERVSLLRRLESLLDQADSRDIRFTIVLKHST